MDLDEIKRGLRAEIKKRENEQYLTFQCNVRQMCKDVLAKLEEQESEIAELKEKLKAQTSIAEEGWKEFRTYHSSYAEAVKELYEKNKELRHQKYKRCLAVAQVLDHILPITKRKEMWRDKWRQRWLELAEKFKEAK